MLSIYNYTEAHKFLKDAWKLKKKKNPAFSMSAWAKQLGLENSSPLSLAFKGQRSLPKKYLPQVVTNLDLGAQEALYLEALLDLSRAKEPTQKMFYLKRMAELSPLGASPSALVDEFKFISDPLHTALLEMTDLKGFKLDPLWIQSRLRMTATREEIAEAITRLLDLNLLSKELGAGRVRKTHKNLGTEQDVADHATKQYHKSVCELAAKIIFEQAVHEREFGSYTFNLKKQAMPKAKEKIRKFFDEFFNEFEAEPGTAEDTYQMSLQLMKLTK